MPRRRRGGRTVSVSSIEVVDIVSPTGATGVASASDSGSMNSVTPAKIEQRLLPTELVHQRDRDRRIKKLPERSRSGAGAERERAPFLRQQFAESTQHDVERTARQTKADEHARRQA